MTKSFKDQPLPCKKTPHYRHIDYIGNKWWRRRESNPRPKIIHCDIYMLVSIFGVRRL
jgi:hypothetical protein